MRRPLVFLVFFLLGFGTPAILGTPLASAEKKVLLREESILLPTYLIREADPLPRFYDGRAYQGAKGIVYPYPMYDRLTDIREEKSYKALYLENEYIELCVLPELGGRIFSALDKTNGYDFFYRQHVIKPALIGMLGAWISGGVEWNIPHHHRATSFLPVDYRLQENDDGSKTIWIGEFELRHRMTWQVGLTLRPGKSFIETTIKIVNRTPFAQAILCWANVSVHTNENYQIIFPPQTEYATYHGKNQFSEWPVSRQRYNRVDYTSGVDISWWKNHPSPTSLFAWKNYDNFLAGYDHGRQAGVVHVANPQLVPGKKFWTWGTGEQGRIWEKILTETDGPYIELMVGAFSDNQPDYSWLQPYEAKTVKQYWFPIRETKGIKAANLSGAVNLECEEKNRIRLGFNTTTAHERAKVLLERDGETVFKEVIDISPDKPYYKDIQFEFPVEEETMRALLLNSEGNELISYKPLPKAGEPFPEPVKVPASPEAISTVEELFFTGQRLEQFYSPVYEPDPYYQEILKRDPGHSRTNRAQGILFLKRGLFQAAEEKFRRALKREMNNYTSPKDGETLYHLGLALLAQEKRNEASQYFYKAAWSQAWSSASFYALAEIACLEKNYTKALELCEQSLVSNSWNTKCLNLKTILLRRSGRLDHAEKSARDILRFSPLDFWAENELHLILEAAGLEDQAKTHLNSLQKMMRNSVQSYLELAVDYGNCGFWGEATEILQRLIDLSDKENSSHPLLFYYLAYYLEEMGEKDKSFRLYEQASLAPAAYCFPFRLESIRVLQRAQELNPEDARAPFYLGNLLYDIQPEQACQQWEKSASLDSSLYLTHRNLAVAYSRVENDLTKAVQSMEEAVRLNPREPRLFYELDLLYEATGKPAQERLSLLEENHAAVKERDDSLSREIILLVEDGNCTKALDLLQNHHFHVWEGGGRIHNVYVDAHLLEGLHFFREKQFEKALKHYQLALEYPENLEVGRPAHGGRFTQVCYFIATAFKEMDKDETAKEYFKKSTEREGGVSELSYYQALSLRELGRIKESTNLLTQLIDIGKERLKKAEPIDFFVKFGEKQSEAKRQAQAHYLVGLGLQGKGETAEAESEFKQVLALDKNHVWARYYFRQLFGK